MKNQRMRAAMRAPAIALPTPIPTAAPGAIEFLDEFVLDNLGLVEFVLDEFGLAESPPDEFMVGLVAPDMGMEDRTELAVRLVDGNGDDDDGRDGGVNVDVEVGVAVAGLEDWLLLACVVCTRSVEVPPITVGIVVVPTLAVSTCDIL